MLNAYPGKSLRNSSILESKSKAPRNRHFHTKNNPKRKSSWPQSVPLSSYASAMTGDDHCQRQRTVGSAARTSNAKVYLAVGVDQSRCRANSYASSLSGFLTVFVPTVSLKQNNRDLHSRIHLVKMATFVCWAHLIAVFS